MWRLLDWLRLRLVKSQAWLELQIEGWGNESVFNAEMSSESADVMQAPEHWIGLVKKQAPWLLRSQSREAPRAQYALRKVPSRPKAATSHDGEKQVPLHAEEGIVMRSAGAGGVDMSDAVREDVKSTALPAITTSEIQGETKLHRVTKPVFQRMAGLDVTKERSMMEKHGLNGANEKPSKPPIASSSGRKNGTADASIKVLPATKDKPSSGNINLMPEKEIGTDKNESAVTTPIRWNVRQTKADITGDRGKDFKIKSRGSERNYVAPCWPPLPGEIEERLATDDPWPVLELESGAESDELFSRDSERERQWSV